MLKEDQIVIYKDTSGKSKVDVKLHDETVWLTQAQIAELFGKERSVITKHIKSILKEEELESATCAKFAQVQMVSRTNIIALVKNEEKQYRKRNLHSIINLANLDIIGGVYA
jgi:hypothetical protein